MIGVVVIGRNEGERLVACLASLAGAGAEVVYVDSGSTDESVANAAAAAARVVALDMGRPFTAARARNAGWRVLSPDVALVQFVDGDCEIAAGWLATAAAFLETHSDCAAVAGRLREKRPEQSIYNRLCDAEWDAPPGEAEACGGVAMMRAATLAAVGGFREDLIAGEEPELCVRMRERGWRIVRLDAEMGRHDAAMTRFGQWWRRAVRGGHAFAEVAEIHKGSPARIWARDAVRPLFWTGLAPVALALGATASPLFLGLLALYPLQIARMARRLPPRPGLSALAQATFFMLAKPAGALGVLRYWAGRLTGARQRLIEHRV